MGGIYAIEIGLQREGTRTARSFCIQNPDTPGVTIDGRIALYQRRGFRIIFLNGNLIIHQQFWVAWCIAQSKTPVVKALGQKNDVGNSVIDGQNDHGGLDTLQDRSQNVEDIAEKPDDEKDKGEAIGRGPAEILNDLWGEYHDPTCD